MNNRTPLTDDPRLTAYALGELEPQERAEVEALLEKTPAARAAVSEIQAMARQLEQALIDEPIALMTDSRAADPEPGAKKARYLYAPAKVTPFPYYWVSGLAAACFAALILFNGPSPRVVNPAATRVEFREMTLGQKRENSAETELIPGPGSSAGLVANDDGSASRELVAATESAVAPARDGTATDGFSSKLEGKESTMPPLLSKQLSAAQGPAHAAPDGPTSLRFTPFSVATSNKLERGRGGLIPDEKAPGKGGLAESLRRLPSTMDQLSATEANPVRQKPDFLSVLNHRRSTFPIAVDTASYVNIRHAISGGQLPPAETVRIEELVNYFPYRYAPPEAGKKETKDPTTSEGGTATTDAATPFAASMEVAAAPWNPAHRLVRIGLKGRNSVEGDRPAANLVFLLDLSNSMAETHKLPLVKQSLRLLVEKLKSTDRIAIVTYGNGSVLALPSTPIANKREILEALDALHAEGSSDELGGVQLAYDVAKANFLTAGLNRVILCTDGDLNVGLTGQGELTRLIRQRAQSGVFLTALGFGLNRAKDALLERLADEGNGNYGYVDTESEAKKLLVDQLSTAWVMIAKDVKLQVEFNPALASAYRLIGYDDRVLKKEEFSNDQVDAPDMGAGHTLTALYEVIPVDAEKERNDPGVEPLKYQLASETADGIKSGSTAESTAELAAKRGELLTLKVRFKPPTVEISRKMEVPLIDTGAAFAAASQDFKFAAAVAGFGMMLRESPGQGTTTYDNVIAWAEGNEGEDPAGCRHEFITLVKKAKVLAAE